MSRTFTRTQTQIKTTTKTKTKTNNDTKEEREEKEGNNRLYLKCPYKDREDCKSKGGRWDPEQKKWYILINETDNLIPFQKWMSEQGKKSTSKRSFLSTITTSAATSISSASSGMTNNGSILGGRDLEDSTSKGKKSINDDQQELLREKRLKRFS